MNEELLRGLLRRFQNGDGEAGGELVARMSPLVSAMAGRAAYGPSETEDCFQVGMIGLLKAARRFNLQAPVKFVTYAVTWIKGEIRTYRRNYQYPLKVSRTLQEQSRALSSLRERLTQVLQRQPTVSELAVKMGISPEEVVLAMEAALPVCSLAEELPLGGAAASHEEELLDRLALYESMSKLSPLERKIIELRFFKELTQAEIAQSLALSQRQVSRLEKRILGQLRCYLQQ
jgi:RNA polymerase sporulation-specific sigma factor